MLHALRRFASARAARALVVPALALTLAACDDDEEPFEPEPMPDIVELASSTPSLSTLVTALQTAGLVSALQGDGPFTVFAPDDDAFASLPTGVLEGLLEPGNETALREVLQLHVVAGEFGSGSLSDGQTLTTLAGEEITVSLDGGVSVNGAQVTTADVEASNGIVHIVDEVILPEVPTVAGAAAATAELSTLTAALEAAGLVETLDGAGSFTVFAPVNEAFAGLPEGTVEALLEEGNVDVLTDLLTFHVVSGAAVYAGDLTDGQTVTTLEGGTLEIGIDGGVVTVNGSTVVTADVRTSNGVVHLVDGVLTQGLDVVQRARITPATETLVSAVTAAELGATLSGEGPFTVFAPVNEAFAALGTEKLEVLLDPANRALLQKVLTYHVVPGDIRAADLTDGATVTTVEGSELTVDLTDGAKVNGTDIVATDIVTSNGVIHLVDGVLTENLDIVDQATLNGFPTLVGAVETAGLTATLRTDNEGAGFTVFAPTEAAFAALDAVPSDPDVLSDILLYHTVGATVGSGDLTDGQVVTTLEGGTFTVRLGDPVVLEGETNNANVVVTDVAASNGVIHVIDAVLIPAS